jgi:NTP pyrophosphatase (non-canonical NTP hydrolase)
MYLQLNLEQLIKEFQLKHNFGIDRSLQNETLREADESLQWLCDKLEIIVRSCKLPALGQMATGDERMYRMYLILEEAWEAAEAMRLRDEVELADALGDLEYVTSGTAVTYNIPLTEVVNEIHKSNMTKIKRCAKTNPRMRDKGPDYVAPNIKTVIETYRRTE